MELLEELETQVHGSLERLEAETRTLHEVYEGIKEQKNSLRQIVARFSQKQSQYRDKGTFYTSHVPSSADTARKVQEVLEEADGLLAIHGTRDPHSEAARHVISPETTS
jgi:peptidoglycan hydrolase CwlO-like protein